MAKAEKIRFSVGTPEDCRAPVWVLWSRKNDVYLAERTSAAREKVSLHASGTWRIAFTTQSGVTNAKSASGDRVTRRWLRPAEFAVGWTRGPAVAVMFAELKAPTPIQDPFVCEGIRWVRAPGRGRKVALLVLFSAPGIERLPWPTYEEVGRLKLADGSSVWLVAEESLMTEVETAFTRHYLTAVLTYRHGAVVGTSAKITVVYEANGQPCFVVIPLGQEHLTSEPAPPT